MRATVGITAAIITFVMLMPGIAAAQDTATFSADVSVAPHATVTFDFETATPEILLTGSGNEKVGDVPLTTASNVPYTIAVHWLAGTLDLDREMQSWLTLTGDFQDEQQATIWDHAAGIASGQLVVKIDLTSAGTNVTGNSDGALASGEAGVYYMENDTREDVGTVQVTVTPQNEG